VAVAACADRPLNFNRGSEATGITALIKSMFFAVYYLSGPAQSTPKCWASTRNLLLTIGQRDFVPAVLLPHAAALAAAVLRQSAAGELTTHGELCY
jgi:hypothetical protein